MFRQLIDEQEHVLEPDDFEFGRTLGELAETLEQAGKLKAAEEVARQCYQHRLRYREDDDFFANLNRLDLSIMLYNLNKNEEAMDLLKEIQSSMARLNEPDESDKELIRESKILLTKIKENI